MRRKKISITILLAILIINNKNIYGMDMSNEINKGGIVKIYNVKESIMVNFYRWDRKTNQKEEYIGTAELKEGKLTYEVKDKRLEKMLKGDFHTMITVEEEDKLINKFVTYKVGTMEHLKSVMDHCKDISCIAEVTQKQEQ